MKFDFEINFAMPYIEAKKRPYSIFMAEVMQGYNETSRQIITLLDNYKKSDKDGQEKLIVDLSKIVKEFFNFSYEQYGQYLDNQLTVRIAYLANDEGIDPKAIFEKLRNLLPDNKLKRPPVSDDFQKAVDRYFR